MAEGNSFTGQHPDRIVVQVTQGGLRNSYLPLAEHLDFFPRDAIGAPNVHDGEGALLTLHFAGLPRAVRTDLTGRHKNFRRRSSWRAFFNFHHLVEGDRVVIERRSAYVYDIAPFTEPVSRKAPTQWSNAEELLRTVSSLRVSRAGGLPASNQPITLLWAISRARRGEPRIAAWAETERSLRAVLERHGRPGERPRPDYPVAALFRAGLWELRGFTGPVPAAHGDSRLRRWFEVNHPDGGLAAPADDLIRRSGQARAEVTATIVDTYLADEDCTDLLADLGLTDEQIAADLATGDPGGQPGDPMEDYRRLCGIAGRRARTGPAARVPHTSLSQARSEAARRAVLIRSEGYCENPGCAGQPADVTDRGIPILEVDHIHDLALGGPDLPEQMIALCPNCHAVKTRGRTRGELRRILLRTALERHATWQTQT